MADNTPATPEEPVGRTSSELVADLERLVAAQDPILNEQTVVQATLEQQIRDLYDQQRERRMRVAAMNEATRRLGVEATTMALSESRTQGVRVFGKVARIVITADRLNADQAAELASVMEGLGRARPGARILLIDDNSIIGAKLVSRQIEIIGTTVAVRIVRTAGEGTEAFTFYPNDVKMGDSRRKILAVGRQQIEEFVSANWSSASLGGAIDIAKAFAHLGLDLKDAIGDEEFSKLDARLLEAFSSYEYPRVPYEEIMDAIAALNGRTPAQVSRAIRHAIVTGFARPMHQLMGANGMQARHAVAALLIREGLIEDDKNVTMHPKVLAEVAKLEWQGDKLAEIRRLWLLASIEPDIEKPTFKGALRIMEVLGTPEELRAAADRMRQAGDTGNFATLLETRAAIIEQGRTSGVRNRRAQYRGS